MLKTERNKKSKKWILPNVLQKYLFIIYEFLIEVWQTKNRKIKKKEIRDWMNLDIYLKGDNNF